MGLLPAGATLAADDAGQAAESYMKAMKENRVDDVAALMHPEALAEFKKMIFSLLDLARKNGSGNKMLSMFGGVKSMDELSGMSGQQLFASFYRGITGMNPMARKLMAESESSVLGQVPEGGELMHVVYRVQVPGQMRSVQVMTMKKTPEGWRVLLTADFTGMYRSLAAQLSRPQRPRHPPVR